MPHVDDTPDDDESDGDGEGTISPYELEEKNAWRHSMFVGEVTVTDGGVLKFVDEGGFNLNEALDEHAREIKTILTRLIIIMCLVVVAILLWRSGLLLRAVGLVG